MNSRSSSVTFLISGQGRHSTPESQHKIKILLVKVRQEVNNSVLIGRTS